MREFYEKRLPTILIVDSERRLRRMLRATLVTHGYDVIKSPNGASALQLLRKTRPDLILLDINLPGVDGENDDRYVAGATDLAADVTARSAQHEKIFARAFPRLESRFSCGMPRILPKTVGGMQCAVLILVASLPLAAQNNYEIQVYDTTRSRRDAPWWNA